MKFEIYEGGEIDKTAESQKEWESQVRARAQEAAEIRRGGIKRETEPESGLEGGSESDHGRNAEPGNAPSGDEALSFQEAAKIRRGQAAEEENRANDIRRDLGLPEQTDAPVGKYGNKYFPQEGVSARATPKENSTSGNMPVVPDAKQYLEDLTGRGDLSRVANLDRSQIFRHPEDFAIFEQEIERILAQSPERPAKLLDVGIGNLEEPLSFLSVVDKEAKKNGRRLEEVIDLKMVDIRNKEDIGFKKGLGKTFSAGGAKIGGAFLTEGQKVSMKELPIEPSADQRHLFALSAESGEYEFLPEVTEYAKKTLDDPMKTSLSTPIENYLANLPENEKFDFVAFNNVVQHLGGNEYANPFQKKGLDKESYNKFYQVVESLLQRVRKDGIIFMHAPESTGDIKSKYGTKLISNELPFFRDNFEELKPGIYKRVK